jgi:acyl-CoA synthetase (AMP-forming)/AMP-acid ligase II
MFKTGGQKVYAEVVEDALESHPDVVEAAVVGVPDETYGKMVVAHIISGETALNADDLEEWCLDHDKLADYQRPREYVFRDELPRTNTGKLNRAPLREE